MTPIEVLSYLTDSTFVTTAFIVVGGFLALELIDQIGGHHD